MPNRTQALRFCARPGTRGLTLALLASLPISVAVAQESSMRYVNPSGLVKPTGYTHLVIAPDGRTVYIAGQVAFDSTGQLVGGSDFRAQAEQVYQNLDRALKSVGGSLVDLVKTTTFITDIKYVPTLRDVRTRHLDRAHPPANTLVSVESLARADLLIEIEGIALLPTTVRH
jgi:enamine deaminase RidA (YjgF/YER057c/UK114 family)